MENDRMQMEQAHQKELTIGAVEANLYALLFVLPILLLFGLPYVLIWHEKFSLSNFTAFMDAWSEWLLLSPLMIILIMAVGVVLHELIHGITWSLFCKNGHRSIRYGVMWEFLTPYCHCKEPLALRPYLLGAVMPAVLLGFAPSVYGIISGSLGWLLFGLTFTLAAGGDFIMIWMLRKESKESFVQDHPVKIGCIVYAANEQKYEKSPVKA
ncbi:DUF3267 domain-containing protein [Nafulsella turpanensis]|uniref:DUF3267 domain-containing protein n=1 Tax=Nafulsella turpanensis TaxID=1265690 RepID=UPI00034A1194|nr:DUF3267 domain-containing protein [Nafulsella turpanensis]